MLLRSTLRIPALLSGALLLVWFAVVAHAEEADEPNELAQFYGFSGIELFKVHNRAFNLQAGDFTSDGLTDVVLVDNHASCLKLFVQKSEEDQRSSRTSGRVNDLGSDVRFEERTIGVDKTLAGLTTGDFNNDGRLDVACIGSPDQLFIRYQPAPGEKEWTEKWTTRLPGLEPVSWMLSAGDLNSDKRTDLVILGKDVTYLVWQNEKGEMETPERLINTSSQLSMIQIADLNGDGRNDLCYLASDGSTRGLCARLQTNDGRLGPEMSFDLQQPRSVTLSNVDLKPGHEVVTVESRNGQIVVSSLKPGKQEADALPTRLLQYGIGPASANRAIAVADLDGDKLTDVLVSDPDQAQVLMYRQNGIDGLGTAEVFPGLLGVTDLAIADLDADSRQDIVLLSPKEGIVALSQFQDERISFPETIFQKSDGIELAAVSVLDVAGKPQIVVAQTQGTGNSMKLLFQRLVRTDAGVWEPVLPDSKLELTGAVGARGVRLVSMDVNGDQRTDLLTVPSGTSKSGVQVLLQQTDGSLALAEQKSQLDLGVSSSGRTFVSGNRLLVARDSFARSLSFTESGWKVEDQFNAGESSASLAGVASLDLDSVAGEEIVLVDTGVKRLRVLRQQEGVYRPWKEVELGNFQFAGTIVTDLNGDNRNDLLLAGAQHFSVLYTGRTDSELSEVASYESDRDESYPADVITGDINADGQIDLAVIDTSIDGLELLNFDAEKGIRKATHFRVFEEKRLVSEGNDRGTEPREGVIADFTGDSRADLILLCHDRLVLYPQDSGESPPKATTAETPTAEPSTPEAPEKDR
jgi:hypothetical protein